MVCYCVFSDIMFVASLRLWLECFNQKKNQQMLQIGVFPFLQENRLLTTVHMTPLLSLIVIPGLAIGLLFTVCPPPLPAPPILHTSPALLFLKYTYDHITPLLKTLQCCSVPTQPGPHPLAWFIRSFSDRRLTSMPPLPSLACAQFCNGELFNLFLFQFFQTALTYLVCLVKT